jgi:type III secretion system low calcium response chaperone LcrH/SycD
MSKEEEIYRTCCALYEDGCYKDAASLFTQLALKDPLEEAYWRGLASSKQMAGRYEEALHAWSVVALLEEKDATPHFHAAECFFALRDPNEGKKALLLAEERLKDTDRLHQKIQFLREYHAAQS